MLTEYEQNALKQLAARSGPVELERGFQTDFWEGMHDRGYARITDSARVGFEAVRGTFVQITDAGREALASSK
jgi:hypothetical protein